MVKLQNSLLHVDRIFTTPHKRYLPIWQHWLLRYLTESWQCKLYIKLEDADATTMMKAWYIERGQNTFAAFEMRLIFHYKLIRQKRNKCKYIFVLIYFDLHRKRLSFIGILFKNVVDFRIFTVFSYYFAKLSQSTYNFLQKGNNPYSLVNGRQCLLNFCWQCPLSPKLVFK